MRVFFFKRAVRRTQRGQAYVEYFVIASLITGGLLLGGDTSIASAVLVALKSFFQAYRHALSIA